MSNKEKKIKNNKEEEFLETNVDHNFVRKSLSGKDKGEVVKNMAKEKTAEIKKKLEEIYENNDGSMPDMKHFLKRKKRRVVRALFTVLLFLLFLSFSAWLGFFVLQGNRGFTEEDVVLSISGEEKLTLGQEVKYKIRYRNDQKVPLAKSNLQIRYPSGFVFHSANVEPDNDKKDEWNLGTIKAGDGGYIEISGKLYGDLNEEQSFRAFLNYTPGNFSSEFQKVAFLNTKISQSPLELILELPEEINSGSELTLTADIKANENVTELPDTLYLRLIPGDNFSKTGSEPENEANNDFLWKIDNTKKEQKIIIKGVINAKSNTIEEKFQIKIEGQDSTSKTNEANVYAMLDKNLKVVQSNLSMSLAINGSTANLSVQPGEKLIASVVIKNNGQSNYKNIICRLIFDMPSYNNKSILKWTELENPLLGDISGEQLDENIRRGSITWTAKEVKGLVNLAPGQETVMDFMVPLKNNQDTDLTQFLAHKGEAKIEMQYELDGQKQMVALKPVQIIINSDLKFTQEEEIITKTDGQEEHKISWVLNNNFHELKDLELSADFYGDLNLVDSSIVSGAGIAKFDQKNKKMLWQIKTMPIGVDVLTLKFSVILNSKNPTQKNLSSKVKIQAEDVATKEKIYLLGDEILLNQGQ